MWFVSVSLEHCRISKPGTLQCVQCLLWNTSNTGLYFIKCCFFTAMNRLPLDQPSSYRTTLFRCPWNFLNKWPTISFSYRILFHAVRLEHGCPTSHPPACLTQPASTFVNYVCTKKQHSNLRSYTYHLLWFLHVRPVKLPTITVVAHCQEKTC
jgi:hypothetical protein